MKTWTPKLEARKRNCKSPVQILAVTQLSSNRDSQQKEFTRSFRGTYFRILLLDMANLADHGPTECRPDSSNRVLQQKSMNKIADASILIEQFQCCSDEFMTQNTRLLTDGSWEDGLKKATYILDIGRQIGEQKADSILAGSRPLFTDGEAPKVSEILYGTNELPVQELTWAEVARKQQKGVMRLVNTLSQD